MNGGDGDDGIMRIALVPSLLRFEDTLIEPIPAGDLAQHITLYHADEDAGYQEEFEVNIAAPSELTQMGK